MHHISAKNTPVCNLLSDPLIVTYCRICRRNGDRAYWWGRLVEDLEQRHGKYTCRSPAETRFASLRLTSSVRSCFALEKMVGEDQKLTSRYKVDMARLPPCHSALKPHLQRVIQRAVLQASQRSDVRETKSVRRWVDKDG